MLRIHQCKSAEAAQSYFTQGLAREDYYIDGQEIAGRWGGRGVDLLGLTRIAENEGVTRGAFVSLTENRHPINGERLTQRTKADRTIGYDFNFHAPKGVSVLHAIHGDDRILETFRAAVQETMQEIERDAATHRCRASPSHRKASRGRNFPVRRSREISPCLPRSCRCSRINGSRHCGSASSPSLRAGRCLPASSTHYQWRGNTRHASPCQAVLVRPTGATPLGNRRAR